MDVTVDISPVYFVPRHKQVNCEHFVLVDSITATFLFFLENADLLSSGTASSWACFPDVVFIVNDTK